METITRRFHQNPQKTARGVAETRLSVEKSLKAITLEKNQSSITSIKHDYHKGTITGKFHQNPLKTVGGDAETRFCLQTDGRADGRTNPLL